MKEIALRLVLLGVIVGSLLSNFCRFTPWVVTFDEVTWKSNITEEQNSKGGNWSVVHNSLQTYNTFNYGMYYSIVSIYKY